MDKSNISKVILKLKEKEGLSMLAKASSREPFHVLISTVLSARNRDEMTEIAAANLFSKFPTAESMAKAKLSDIEPLIRKSGFYRTKAKRVRDIARAVVKSGKVPDTMGGLVELPGVGRKTAGCVLVYAFGTPAIPVDTHVHRISNRLGWVRTKHPEETERELMRIVPRDLWIDVNEVFVVHGQTICKPITPQCQKCPVEKWCEKRI